VSVECTMARISKKSSDAATTVVSTSAPASVNAAAAAAPSDITASKTKVSKKAAKLAAAAEASAAAVSTDTTTAPSPEEGAEGEILLTEQSLEFLAKLQQLGVLISSLKTEYRNLEKKWTRELKTAQKQSTKRKRKSGNRAPSGFVKPTRISDELAKFLEKTPGTEMARTEVTRDINKYIRTNNLQDKANGRKINPDNKLAALLKLKKDEELTYFNLQKYMSPHFAKAVAAAKAIEVTV
jgi:chromatin remodeling complex protein RSC6